MRLHSEFIGTVELSRPAALQSYVSFATMFDATRQKRRPAQLGNNMLATAHIAKWNKLTSSEFTESTSSMVDETALPIRT
jgi:hypothetical protein